MFEPTEIITNESYYALCDYHYKGQDDLPSGIVAVDIQSIPEFFQKITGNDKRYVVVSSRSDFGLRYQKDGAAWQDIEKWCGMMATPDLGYNDVSIPARVDRDKCRQTDKYCIKCWAWTSHTFDEIPENVVHWFMTNCYIHDDQRITPIPFGINGTNGCNEAREKIAGLRPRNRTKLMYVNFQFYTVDRYRLYEYYKGLEWVTAYHPSEGRSLDDYLADISEHRFVLCPEGNGADCYRMLEVMYTGGIPIMPMVDGLYFYVKYRLPVLFMRNMYAVNPKDLQSIHIPESQRNYEPIMLSYWKNEFQKSRKFL